MFSLRILFGGAERLRGHLCICCFGSSGMWSVGLETVRSDRPAAPREALPGGSDVFKGGSGRAAPEESQRVQFFIFFCLVSFCFFFHFPARFISHAFIFWCIFFFCFLFLPGLFCCFHLSFLSSWTEMENRCSDPRGG